MIESRLVFWDWVVVVGYFVVMLWVGLAIHRHAGKNMRIFFTSDGNLAWWLVAASLVATSFGSDTPLWVTGLVRNFGIHAVWQYWTYFLGAGLAVFLFSRMWRRSGVITDLELLEIRYSGKGAAFVRGFGATWGAVVMNTITIGWVTKAMQTILVESLGLSREASGWALAVIVVVTLVYCAVSGLFGVVITDAVQLILALIGTLSLAWIVLNEVGGPAAMVEKLQSMEAWPGHTLAIGPEFGTITATPPGALSFWNFIALLGFAWIGLSYCQGYICQRMLAAKNQHHASKAMLGYTLFYWGFLAWPWIIVALCSLILLSPEQMAGKNAEAAYPMMAMIYLPTGLRGVLFVALVAAYMSTVATMINFGASYAVNDIYRRFLHKHGSDAHYVLISRLFTAMIAIAGALVAWVSESVIQLLQLAGVFSIGIVLIPALRWFWWRMTPWAEFFGFCTSVVCVIFIVGFKALDPLVATWLPLYSADGALLSFGKDWDYFGLRILAVMIPVTLVAVLTAFLSKPASDDQLRQFVERLRPPRFAWARTAKRLGFAYEPGEPAWLVLCGWASITLCIGGLLYAIGWLVLGRIGPGLIALAVFLVCLCLSLWLSRDADSAKHATHPGQAP